MKVLPPVDHTAMDSIVWAEVCIRTNESACTLYTRSLMRDKGDAELILKALESRVVCLTVLEADKFRHRIVWVFNAGPYGSRFRPLEMRCNR